MILINKNSAGSSVNCTSVIGPKADMLKNSHLPKGSLKPPRKPMKQLQKVQTYPPITACHDKSMLFKGTKSRILTIDYHDTQCPQSQITKCKESRKTYPNAEK